MDIRAVTEGALNLAERFNNFRQADLNGRIGQRLDRAQDMIESGDLKSSDFQLLMRLGFGNSVNSAFSEDGSIDYAALQETVTSKVTEQRTNVVKRRLGAAEFGVESGLLPPAVLQAGLFARYGASVSEAFGDDAVDFERLKAIILGQSTAATEDTDESAAKFSATA